MERLAIVARLRAGAEERAKALIAAGPPFDPGAHGIQRHAVYLSARDVIFVFEGDEIEWSVDDLLTGPGPVAAAREDWRELVEEPVRAARLQYFWERPQAPGAPAH